MRIILTILVFGFLYSFAFAQEPKHFSKEGLSFDYSNGWALEDASNSDTQTLKLSRPDADLQLSVSAHKGRITAEKMADAHKALIDPYVEAFAKQFTSMGAKAERTPETSEIGGVPAEGVRIKFSFGTDTATAQIYWALVGQRVVIVTYFGPEADRKKYASGFDLIRTSLKVEEPKPKASPSPK
ncbi:MAG: hypothetical protein C5B55_00605 [Blastocatellia bacterium]|nr:MAG: hypothetical protein C5B55_00605 [Blastocatellia bacterium]